MATTGASLSIVSEAIKKAYADKISEQFYNNNYLMKKLQSKVPDVVKNGANLQFNFPLSISSNERIRSSAEADTALVGGHTTKKMATSSLKYLHGQVELSEQAILAMGGGLAIGSVAGGLDKEMKDLADSFEVDQNRQLWGDGTGILCLTNGAQAATDTFTVDGPDARYLRASMPIFSASNRAGTSTTNNSDISYGLAEATAFTVFEKDPNDSTKFDLGNAASTAVQTDSVADNRYIFRWGNNNGKEITGLGKIIEDYTSASTYGGFREDDTVESDLYGISRATYKWMNANVVHNSKTNRALTVPLMQKGFDRSMERLGMGKFPDLIITNTAIARKYGELVVQDRIFTNIQTPDGGWGSNTEPRMTFNGVPILIDPYAPANRVYFIRYDALYINRGGNDGWIDNDGRVLYRDTTKVDVFAATYRSYWELTCDCPGKLTVITDVSES